ncbi:hypothetical protein [Roseateles amylovorans]|uniref:Uncharacterized protein n=1 Tax=Roseateles amylovorans TaxID=2978473 RepID=A0ABY6B1I2_9BURK|nr:hypothetical protein [Roseateles amylovorans]UXH77373.1 hypothetical protein N4261_20565 [Roseateles amylovorans]
MGQKIFPNVDARIDTDWLIKGYFNYLAESGRFFSMYIQACKKDELRIG